MPVAESQQPFHRLSIRLDQTQPEKYERITYVECQAVHRRQSYRRTNHVRLQPFSNKQVSRTTANEGWPKTANKGPQPKVGQSNLLSIAKSIKPTASE